MKDFRGIEMHYRILHHIKEGDISYPLHLDLLIEKINRLIIHEETIEENLEELRKSFKKHSYFWHPIIVDRNTNVVLDGMHRVRSLKEIGYEYIPILKVDGMGLGVKLERWIRCYPGVCSDILRFLKKGGVEVEKVIKGNPEEVAIKGYKVSSSDRPIHLIDLQRGILYKIIMDQGGPVSLYKKVKEVEKRLEELLGGITYTTFISFQEEIDNNKCKWALIPPPLKKEEVFEAAVKGVLFPPKSTRFVLPVRIMFVNTPIYLLERNHLTFEERNLLNYLILRQRRFFRIEGNVDIDRHYEEPCLYLFE